MTDDHAGGPEDGPRFNPDDESTIDLPRHERRNAAASSRFASDTLLAGRYRIVRFIGEGGMGSVYEALDIELQERVALKIIRPEVAKDSQVIDRFKREVNLARKVTHPNVARIFDIGHHADEVTFLSMELLSGETLLARLRREGRMTPERALPLVTQMAAGLAAAHKAGIVHRDFKSANVMLVSSEGGTRAVVADFGIARGIVTDDASLTATGAMMGTPDYMAPEQVKGGTVTAAVDQYALGVVIYEMVAGAKPFSGETPLASAVKRLSEAPTSPRAHVPDLDPNWEAAILRCLERDPADRFASVSDFVKTLEGERVAEGKQTRTARLKSRLRASLAGAAIVLLAASFVAYRFVVPPIAAIESIAVLPFINVGGDPDTEYLSEGLTESLIDDLSRLPDLSVKSRNAVSRYQGPNIDAQKAGRELRVEAILTGSVSPRAENLSVGSELVDVRKGSHLWGDRYDRKLVDVLALQTEIVRRIAETIRPSLKGEAAERAVKPRTQSPEAFQLYLKGRYSSSRYTKEGFTKGIDDLTRAVQVDPSYALAYAGLATCYYDASGLTLLPKDAMRSAKAAAQEALKLDDTLAEAHMALALVLANYDWNWPDAEKEYLRAIELQPNLAQAHRYYGYLLLVHRRFDEAVVEMTKARDLDPLTTMNSAYLAYANYLRRQFDDAADQYKSIIEIDPTFVVAHYTLGLVYEKQGRLPEAFDEFEKAGKLDAGSNFVLAQVGLANGLAGNEDEARRIVKELESRSGREYVDPASIALVYAGLGDNDSAFAWLEKAFDIRSEEILVLNVDPKWDTLRSDPRLAALTARAGL